MGKREFNIFLIFFTFLIIQCINHYYNDVFPAHESLGNTCKMCEVCATRNDRLLAKHEIQKNMKYSVLREKNMKEKNEEVNAATYEKIKNETLNELDAYMRSYYSRYIKCNGLRKLECSCEKKIFEIIDRIDREGKGNNKNLKKKLHWKYGFSLITTCLIPLVVVIIPVINKLGKLNDIIENFKSKEFYIAQSVIFILLSYIILLFIIYIMIKIIKYKKLKAKKGKMNFNEYCGFCKEVFSK